MNGRTTKQPGTRVSKPVTPEPEPRMKVMTDEEAASDPRAVARSTLSPGVQAAHTVRSWRRTGKPEEPENRSRAALELLALTETLFDQCKDISAGDMRRPEATLGSQPHVLDAIFNELAQRAALNVRAGYVDTAETYLKLALRAQSQCRATLETLALLKNPPSIAFVRQANVANGPQQVNNAPLAKASRARESENPPNELLEQQRNDRMDTVPTQATVGTDRVLETVGEVHGAANPGRQEPGRS